MTASDVRKLYDAQDWRALAARIDTGAVDHAFSRALIVFNEQAMPASGAAVFAVDMPWRPGRALPPICVTRLGDETPCASRISTPQFREPEAAQQYGRLKFELQFEVRDVPPYGWDTYIAEYLPESAPSPAFDPAVSPAYLTVIETTRHTGQLPARWPG